MKINSFKIVIINQYFDLKILKKYHFLNLYQKIHQEYSFHLIKLYYSILSPHLDNNLFLVHTYLLHQNNEQVYELDYLLTNKLFF